jgi:glycine cleavage system H protein
MTTIRSFLLPDDLHYVVEKHVWIRFLDDGLARVGLTTVAYSLLRRSLVAISLRQKVLGQEVARGKSVAMVESLKYIGPVPAPFTGTVVRANDAVLAQASLAEADPYGAGWLVEMRPADSDSARASLPTGDAAMADYRALIESQNIVPLDDAAR